MFIRRTSVGLRRLLPLAAACLLPAAASFAGTSGDTDSSTDTTKDITQAVLDKVTPLNTTDDEVVYIGQSHFAIKHGDGPAGGVQIPYEPISETELSLEYGRRFHLFGHVYLKVAADYDRFDFSTTDAPIPTSLQNLGGVLAVEYIEKGEVGAFFRLAPGAYYSNFDQINGANFNMPISLGSIVPIGKKFYVLVGADINVWTKYKVSPILGVVWLITDHLRVIGTPPDPQLVYSVSDALDLFIGGEVLSESYKRDYNPNYRPQDQRFSGAVVDYSEYRVGGGMTITPIKKLDMDIDIAGGWNISQDFDFFRGESTRQFKVRGAPYARLSVSAKF